MSLEMQQRLIVVTNFEHKILLKDLLEVPAIQKEEKKNTNDTYCSNGLCFPFFLPSFFLFFFFSMHFDSCVRVMWEDRSELVYIAKNVGFDFNQTWNLSS